MRPRDSQKQRLYTAEKVVVDGSRKFETIPEVQSYLHHVVLADEWFKREFGFISQAIAYDGRGRRNACGWRSYHVACMKLPKWSRTEAVILHELAHAIQPRDSAHHGPEFCSIYLRLVYRFLGKKAHERLVASFVEHRIKYTWVTHKNWGLPPTQSLVQEAS